LKYKIKYRSVRF